MDILAKIVAKTRTSLIQRKIERPLDALKSRCHAATLGPSRLSTALRADPRPHIIAEFKRKSPSRAAIDLGADPRERARNYEAGGASAISVLTEPEYFGGALADLTAIREAVSLPLLRKDFMIDEYQFYEARAAGADLILLIARILTAAEIRRFSQLAHELGMEVLCEIHEVRELERIDTAPIDFLGVNCRDLKRFDTHLDRLTGITRQLPPHLPWVAESGIQSPADLQLLSAVGYRLFLIGEYLMKSGDPAAALRELRV